MEPIIASTVMDASPAEIAAFIRANNTDAEIDQLLQHGTAIFAQFAGPEAANLAMQEFRSLPRDQQLCTIAETMKTVLSPQATISPDRLAAFGLTQEDADACKSMASVVVDTVTTPRANRGPP